MAVALTTPQVETKTVASVQITGFSINYENLEMRSEYITLLDDGTPYQRGQASTSDETEIAGLMEDIQTKVLDGQPIEEASSEIAYAFVLSKLG